MQTSIRSKFAVTRKQNVIFAQAKMNLWVLRVHTRVAATTPLTWRVSWTVWWMFAASFTSNWIHIRRRCKFCAQRRRRLKMCWQWRCRIRAKLSRMNCTASMKTSLDITLWCERSQPDSSSSLVIWELKKQPSRRRLLEWPSALRS